MTEDAARPDAAERVRAQAEAIAEQFAALLQARLPLARDRALTAELAREAIPVAAAILEGLEVVPEVRVDAVEMREARALTSLLGRRAARLGATPTAMLEVVSSLLRAIDPSARAEVLRSPLTAVLLEGYVAAREEQLAERAAEQLAEATPIVEIVPGCVAIFLSGPQTTEAIGRTVEDVGRRLLERDAKACILDVSGLLDPTPQRAAQLLTLSGTCHMLGVRLVIVGLGEAWRDAAAERGLPLDGLALEKTFSGALATALPACDLEVRPRSALGGVLRRLVGRSA